MSCRLRIEYPGAFYHVMNRGVRQQPIFVNNGHRITFLKYLKEAIKKYHIKCLGYCLMGNHYHLLLMTPEGNLSQAMHYIGSFYSQQFNRFEGYDGQLFRGRYHAVIVENNSYLLNVIRYMHLNPTLAGIEHTLGSYPWSCLRYYLGQEMPPDWISMEYILEQFQDNPFKQYLEFVSEGIDDATKVFYSKKRIPFALGSNYFCKRYISQLKNTRYSISEEESTCLSACHDIESICKIAECYFRCSHADLLRSVGKDANISRNIAIYLCKRYTKATRREIAEYFKLGSLSSVSHIAKRVTHLGHQVTKHIIKLEHLLGVRVSNDRCVASQHCKRQDRMS